jgi:hypothetical protein
MHKGGGERGGGGGHNMYPPQKTTKDGHKNARKHKNMRPHGFTHNSMNPLTRM